MASRPLDETGKNPAAPMLLLVGPTASGKTGVAHELARRCGCRVLSADSMMVYQGMDVGTAKPSREEQAVFGYAGIDLATPDRPFSVVDYLEAVAEQLTAGTAWLVTGGTGLYVRGLLEGIDAGGGADPVLRADAETCWKEGGMDALKAWCLERVPELEHRLPPGDLLNPRRWIRALERASTGRVASRPLLDAGRCIIVGLSREREDLEARIRARVDRMMEQGLLDEVRRLRRQVERLSGTAEKAIGYAEAGEVLDGDLSVDAAKARMVVRTRQYAKRQMTWFRHQLPTRWIEAGPVDSDAVLADRVEGIWHG